MRVGKNIFVLNKNVERIRAVRQLRPVATVSGRCPLGPGRVPEFLSVFVFLVVFRGFRRFVNSGP